MHAFWDELGVLIGEKKLARAQIDSVLSSLGTSRNGIGEEEAKMRLERYGFN